MIKTMLLTAQLALSPIVGTNGLQPKCLPNPVYGEEVNLNVEAWGKTYKRVFYGAKGTKISLEQVEAGGILYLGWKQDQEQTPCLYSEFPFANRESTIPILEPDYYLAWAENGDNLIADELMFPDDNFYISFWHYNGNNNTYAYLEYFFANENYEMSTTLCWTIFDNNGNYTSEQKNNDLGYDEYNLCTFGNLYMETPREMNWQGHRPYVPIEAPTIPNPSVYDNIYNFYYQNLFANDALDELGAEVGNNSLTMRQWLAHTATIVSISLLSAALVILVIKIFKLIAGSISDIWG